MRLRSLAVALCAGAILAIGLAGFAGAHVVQQFGPYSLAIGWLHEPAYVGLDNAVQIIVEDSQDKSVDDVPANDFTVTVSTAGQTSAALPLNASFDPDEGLGTPGEYTAHLIPTAPGPYTFHIVGTIHGTKVDQSFTSSDTTFDAVQGQADAQFPVKVPSGTELSARVDRIDTRVQAAQTSPLSGNAASLAGQELRGVRIAADLVNAAGGVDGRRIELDVRDLESTGQAPAVMAALKSDGASVVVGAYSSDLSIAASTAADAAGLLYWEAGAVADRLTGRGLPLVFRVGASGTNLGTNSASFAVGQLAPRLGKTTSQLRLAIVSAGDDYASSVAAAAARTADAAGAPVVARITYDLVLPGWPTVMRQLAAAKPDVIILASHIPDGVAFRRAMLAAGVHVGALIGSTMAECDPDFAGDLGPAAVGVFASDRPTGGFQPTALGSAARAVYDRFARSLGRGPGCSRPDPVEHRRRRVGCLRQRSDLRPVCPPARRVLDHRSRHLGDELRGPDRGGHLRVLRRVGAVRRRPARRWTGDGQCGRSGSGSPRSRSAGGRAPERGWAPVLGRSGDPRPEHAGGGRHLAVAGGPLVHVRLASDLRHGNGRLRPARPMSAFGRPTPSSVFVGASKFVVTPLIRPALIVLLLAAVIGARWAATVGALADGLTIGTAFGVVLISGVALVGWRPAAPTPRQLVAGGVVGLAGGMTLVGLALVSRWPGPWLPFDPAGSFMPWAAVTVIVATGEELMLRGALFDALDEFEWHGRGAHRHLGRFRAASRPAVRLARGPARRRGGPLPRQSAPPHRRHGRACCRARRRRPGDLVDLMARRRAAVAVLGLGLGIAAAAQVAAPMATLPLYDGVVVVQPYVYVDPPPAPKARALPLRYTPAGFVLRKRTCFLSDAQKTSLQRSQRTMLLLARRQTPAGSRCRPNGTGAPTQPGPRCDTRATTAKTDGTRRPSSDISWI